MKKIMVIGAGEFQVPLIKECKKQGYFTIATDFNPNAEGFKYTDVGLNIDTLDKNLTLEKALEYNIDGILTTSDYPVRTVAYVCEKMNLPGLNTKAAETSTNKFLLRECLKGNNIDCPSYWVLNRKNSINDFIDEFIFPVVVKPVDSSASRGVVKVNDKSGLGDAYKEALHYSKSGDVIVEEFLEGPEYSVEALTQAGKTYIIAITEKTTTGSPYFVEERHVIPANLTKIQESEIKAAVIRTIKAIGIDNSASHTEIKLTAKGVRIIEIGARLGGDYITSDLVPLSTGVNMLNNIIKLSLGLEIDIEITANKHSGIQFITSDNYKKISENINKLQKNTSIIRVCIDENINSSVKLTNSLDRLGYFICCTEDKETLNSILDEYT